MNQFFYETRGKEKIKNLMKEGMRSQALNRSGPARNGIVHNLPKLALMILGLLSVFGILALSGMSTSIDE